MKYVPVGGMKYVPVGARNEIMYVPVGGGSGKYVGGS